MAQDNAPGITYEKIPSRLLAIVEYRNGQLVFVVSDLRVLYITIDLNVTVARHITRNQKMIVMMALVDGCQRFWLRIIILIFNQQ